MLVSITHFKLSTTYSEICSIIIQTNNGQKVAELSTTFGQTSFVVNEPILVFKYSYKNWT